MESLRPDQATIESRDWHRDLSWGVWWGLLLTLINWAFFVIAVILGALSGDRLDLGGLTVTQVLVYELLGGICGGAVLGLLRPQADSPVGAAFVGFVVVAVAGIPLIAFAPDIIEGGWAMTVAVVVLTAAVLGAPCGYIFHHMDENDDYSVWWFY